MSTLPTLETERLVLSPATLADAAAVQFYAGDEEIARTTANIPHPYPDGAAEAWIESHEAQYLATKTVILLMRLKPDSGAVGSVGISVKPHGKSGELGYWLAKPLWGQGITTEAAQAVIDHMFREIGLELVSSHHMVINPASGRVMEKLGMRREGELRGAALVRGELVDLVRFSVTRAEWLAAHP